MVGKNAADFFPFDFGLQFCIVRVDQTIHYIIPVMTGERRNHGGMENPAFHGGNDCPYNSNLLVANLAVKEKSRRDGRTVSREEVERLGLHGVQVISFK